MKHHGYDVHFYFHHLILFLHCATMYNKSHLFFMENLSNTDGFPRNIHISGPLLTWPYYLVIILLKVYLYLLKLTTLFLESCPSFLQIWKVRSKEVKQDFLKVMSIGTWHMSSAWGHSLD